MGIIKKIKRSESTRKIFIWLKHKDQNQ